MRVTFEPIALDATLASLSGKAIAVTGMGDRGEPRTFALEFGKVGRRWIKVRFGDLSDSTDPVKSRMLRLPIEARVGDAVLGLTHVKLEGAGIVPRVAWPMMSESQDRRRWLIIAFLCVMFITVVTQQFALMMFMLIPLVFGRALKGSNESQSPPRVQTASRGEIFASQVRAMLPAVVRPEVTGALSPTDRVAVVKERYGDRVMDIVYRIENSALFDNAVPQTQRFQLALLAWDPQSPEAGRLADEVEASFAEAVRHAEEVGLDHLPATARPKAERAAKAATTALSSVNDAERAAARRRVVEILSSLALYYLPVADAQAPSLIGERRQIEPSP